MDWPGLVVKFCDIQFYAPIGATSFIFKLFNLGTKKAHPLEECALNLTFASGKIWYEKSRYFHQTFTT